jgi:transposase
MPSRKGPVHVATINKKHKGKIYKTHLLRRTFREEGKVKHETLGNISHLPDDLIETIRQRLSGDALPQGPWEIRRNIPHGHVALVLGVLRDIGLDAMIGSKPCRERDLCIAMIVSRIVAPGSKLACARSINPETATHSVGVELGIDDLRDRELYEALDWLLSRQNRIEKKLAKRHLHDGTLLLYDLSGSYYTGKVSGLVQYGYSRDQKSGHPQVVYGLLCDAEGCPISIEVFAGNTSDATTLGNQIKKVRSRFDIKRVVMVGDRGMITSKRIDEEMRGVDGLDWISALRNDAIKKLASQEAISASLFDERDLAEITSEDHPGERLVVCRNPLLAEKRRHAREELLCKTEAKLEEIVAATQREKRALKGKDKIGIRVGRTLEKHGMGKHFIYSIEENRFSYRRNEEKIAEETALDGIYIVRTSLDAKTMGPGEAVLAYKNLARVERAFRCMKNMDLKVRPIYHRLDDRIKAHIFLCMLAYYVEWHLRRRIKSVLFEDEDREIVERERTSEVAPAPRSQKAKRKESVKRTEDHGPVHSFQTLLKDMGTLCRNLVRMEGSPHESTFMVKTQPTEFQAHVFNLAGIKA